MKRNRPSDNEDFNELKRKIDILKIADIQKLLGNYNISKTGRKSELQDRLMSLVKNGSLTKDQQTKLIEKINEIAGNLKQPSILNMLTKVEGETKKLKVSEDSKSIMLVQPEIKFKKIPFFDQLDVLLPPSILTPSNTKVSDQVKCFMLNLTHEQANNIEKNIIMDATNVEYNVQVQFRICLAESTEQKDSFPLNFQLRVNNRICQLPPFLPSRPNTTPKRSSKPLNITNLVKVSSVLTNIIEVRWQRDLQHEKDFAITCCLVRKLSSDDLLNRLKVQAENLTRGMIKDKLSKEVDSEIATTMLRVSLICPLGKIRMKIPCRASTCKHLQCFDALLYLQMNECKQSWICPVCDKEALFENLFIDGYFSNVIKTLSIHDNEIQLHKDGTWSKLEEIVKEVHSDDGFVISDDEDANNNNKPSIIGELKVKRKVMHVLKKMKVLEPVDSIDLTLDD